MRSRPLVPGLRVMLAAASVLVFLAGVPLFLGSEQTDLYFAWTIAPPLTAAFLGAAYWSSLLMTVLSLRRGLWASGRLAVAAILVVSVLILAATALHLDRFHLASPVLVAQLVAWAWLIVYLVVPPLILIFLVVQLRSRGEDAPRQQPLPLIVRLVLGAQAAVMLPCGALLFLIPQIAGTIWPWMLTPLTARAIGAWLIGLGTVAALGTSEDDFDRVSFGLLSSFALGVLELLALARYPSFVRWNDPATWIYLAMLLSILLVGAYGLVNMNRRRGQPADVSLAT